MKRKNSKNSKTIAVLHDIETGTAIKISYDKYFTNDAYEVYFDSESGIEVLRGCKGKLDPFATDLPLMCDVGIMGHCENKCQFCYQGYESEDNMTLEDFKTIIDQVKHHTNQVALGGRGDPNLHLNFKEIVEYARNNDVVPNYTTSGIGLTDEQVEISKMCGAVAVSDYETPYTYDALDKFMKANIKTNIHMVLSRPNMSKSVKILYGYNPWKKYYLGKSSVDIEKLNAVVFLLFKPQGEGANHRDMILTDLNIQTIADLIIESRCKFKVGMDSCLVNHVIQRANISKKQQLTLDTCESARMSVYISPSMKMMPCSFANKDMGVQIDKKNNIQTIWQKSKPFKRFRKSLKINRFVCPAGF
jgi:MoaA/NifB/PqqE/SkfB family radical SAM enzyme